MIMIIGNYTCMMGRTASLRLELQIIPGEWDQTICVMSQCWVYNNVCVNPGAPGCSEIDAL